MRITVGVAAAVAALLLAGCGEQPAPAGADDKARPTAAPTSKEPQPVKKKEREPEVQPGPSSRARESARQAVLAYNEVAKGLRRGDMTDAELVTGLQEVAVLALISEDPLLSAAADRMFNAAQQGDRDGIKHAARVFVSEAKRLVPGHRVVTPGDVG